MAWSEKQVDRLSSTLLKDLEAVEKFVEQANVVGGSTLVFCSNGQNRSLSVVILLLMRRFRWSFYKTLQFLDSRRPNLEIKQGFFRHLKEAASILEASGTFSKTWNKLCGSKAVAEEELQVTNTYLNSQVDLEDGTPETLFESNPLKRVVWIDQLEAAAIKPKKPKAQLDKKKIENFFRQKKREEEEPEEKAEETNKEEKTKPRSESLFSQGLKNLRNKLLVPEQNLEAESQSNSGLSKISTTIFDDSVLEKTLKAKPKDVKKEDRKPSKDEYIEEEKREKKRPSSAPAKDEKKEKLIQMHLFLDGRKKSPVLAQLLRAQPMFSLGKSLAPDDELRRSKLASQKLA